MLPSIWLAFHVCFVWASPGFVHSDDSIKKVVTSPLAQVQQGLCDCRAVPLLQLGHFMGYSTHWKFTVTKISRRMWSRVLWHSPTSAANSRAVHRLSEFNREASSWTVLFSPWGHPVRRSSWTASLPSRNALTYRATVRHGNTASPYASRSNWKHSCVLRSHVTLISMQERCSNFVNIVLRRSHDPYENQRSTHWSKLTE